MITIRKGQSNEVWLTLPERTTLGTPVYLFEFISDFTKKSVTFLCSFTLVAEYAVFDIVESDTAEPLNGIITLNPSGFWAYTVYEQMSTTNIVPSLAFGVVETGKVQVLDTPYTDSVYTQQSTTNEVYVNGE